MTFDRRRVGNLRDAVLARIALERFLRPLAVRSESRVSIGLVGKAAGARCLAAVLLKAVLGATGASEGVPALGDGPTERLFLVCQRLLAWGKERVEEVLRRGVLLQAAYQVGHGDVEVFCVDNRGIEDLAAVKDLAHRCLLCWGHALQHLRIHHVQHAALLAQLVGHCGGVQVVGCYTDADAAGVLLAQDEIQQAVVVSVYVELVGVGSQRPIVDLALHIFHGQVRALHDAHLDLAAALSHALLSKVSDILERIKGIRQVSLQHDAGIQSEEFRLAEQLLEQADGQVEIVVLLHVHVDKDLVGTVRRSLVQRTQALLEALYRAIDIPVVKLGHHGGSLDRNVGYAWVPDELEGALRAGLSLFLTEHGLTQQVEVKLFTGFGSLVQDLVEGIRLGVQNQVAYHLAHVQAGNRHD